MSLTGRSGAGDSVAFVRLLGRLVCGRRLRRRGQCRQQTREQRSGAGLANEDMTELPGIPVHHPPHFSTRPLLGRSSLGECGIMRSEEHTSELQSLMSISYAVFCLKKKK